MYNTSERIRRVKLLARELQNKRETRLFGGLSALCLVLSFSLVGVIRSMTGGVQGKAKGTYGTMLLYENAGGYVLVAVITFALASLITLVCISYREKNKKIGLEKEDKKI